MEGVRVRVRDNERREEGEELVWGKAKKGSENETRDKIQVSIIVTYTLSFIHTVHSPHTCSIQREISASPLALPQPRPAHIAEWSGRPRPLASVAGWCPKHPCPTVVAATFQFRGSFWRHRDLFFRNWNRWFLNFTVKWKKTTVTLGDKIHLLTW